MFCCKGFCMDLLRELSSKINFTYNLTLSPDGQFGSYIIKNNTGKFVICKYYLPYLCAKNNIGINKSRTICTTT